MENQEDTSLSQAFISIPDPRQVGVVTEFVKNRTLSIKFIKLHSQIRSFMRIKLQPTFLSSQPMMFYSQKHFLKLYYQMINISMSFDRKLLC